MSTHPTSKKVVIVGNGICGRIVAQSLVADKSLCVTIVAGTPFVEWSVAGTYVLARPEELASYVGPNKSEFEIKGVSFVYGLATGIEDASLRYRPLGGGEAAWSSATLPPPMSPGAADKPLLAESPTPLIPSTPSGDEISLPYDVLVLATGFSMPTITATPGCSLGERRTEVQSFNDAVKGAASIVIGGGGVVGLELAGDIFEVMPAGCKLTVVSSSEALIPTNPPAESARALAQLHKMGVEVVLGDRVSSHSETLLEKGATLTLKSGKEIKADVYVPAHTRGPRTQWIAPEMLDTAGNGGVAVNAHLQSPSNPKVFAVGPCNSLGEPAMIMKYEAQCLLVAKNVKALIKGAALRAHKEAEPAMKASPVQKIGHNTYAFTSTNAPFYPVVKACGYPCNLLCPCVWCSVCGCLPCGPDCVACCGPCCGEPEGKATALVWKKLMMVFFKMRFGKAAGSKPLGTKGGEAPKPEAMSR